MIQTFDGYKWKVTIAGRDSAGAVMSMPSRTLDEAQSAAVNAARKALQSSLDGLLRV